MRPSIPTPFPRSYWVIPGRLLAGAYPGAKDPAEASLKLKALFDAGIRTTINLMEADEHDQAGNPFADYSGTFQGIVAARRERVACERFPIPDLGVPDAEGMRRILDAIDASLEGRQPVYVHCWGGIGRTGTVVGCFLVRHGLAEGDTAIERIRRLRQPDSHKDRPSPETPEQERFIQEWRQHEGGPPTRIDRYMGCMLGGAIGDALGAPVEFASLADIRRRYGSEGIQDFDQAYGRVGAITDDTQMTLFTAEGMLRANSRGISRGVCHPPSVVHHAYVQWLNTQGEKSRSTWDGSRAGWLHAVKALHDRRAPGNSCLSALRQAEMGTIESPANNSKGCGGVMRVAPVGLIEDDPQLAFKWGCETAAITHGHPSGYLAAGALAAMICMLKTGGGQLESIGEARRMLAARPQSGECLSAIDQALSLAQEGAPTPEKLEGLGAGWVAEEALGISIYCALAFPDDFAPAVRLAVNHSGDSDSTGSITGQILGAILGRTGIPDRWVNGVELSELVQDLGLDLWIRFLDHEAWKESYPAG
jgi:ADP-ribosylglycohydrolase